MASALGPTNVKGTSCSAFGTGVLASQQTERTVGRAERGPFDERDRWPRERREDANGKPTASFGVACVGYDPGLLCSHRRAGNLRGGNGLDREELARTPDLPVEGRMCP